MSLKEEGRKMTENKNLFVNNESRVSFLGRIQIAIVKNIINGDGLPQAATKAVEWMKGKIKDDDLSFFFSRGLDEILEMMSDSISRDLLEFLRPKDEGFFLSWAEASLRLIEAEYEELPDRQRATEWLRAILIEEIGRANATIWFAERVRPEIDQPQEDWARRTFLRFSRIKDVEERAIAHAWLERQITPFCGGEDEAKRIIQEWMHCDDAETRIEEAPPTVRSCGTTPKNSHVRGLRPTVVTSEPSEEEVQAMITTIRAEMLQAGIEYSDEEVCDALIEDARRRIISQRSEKAA
jgi:hypothetical protein